MTAAANTGYVTSSEELSAMAVKMVSVGRPISLDCETGYEGEARSYKNTSPSLHPEESVLAGFNFTNAASWARYAPVFHDETRYNLDPRRAAEALWLICRSGLVVVHNADMEERTLSRFLLRYLGDHPEYGSAVRASRGYFPLRSDTMMECHALAQWRSIALKSLSWDVFGYKQTELIELFNEVVYGQQGKKLPANKRYQLRFNLLDPSDPRVFGYACDDAIQTWRLHDRHYESVKDNFIYWLEMNVWPIVWAMEDEGLEVDWDFLDEAKVRARVFHARMQGGMQTHLTERLDRIVKFNPNSFQQIGKILYSPAPEGLGLRTHIMTKGKKDGSDKKMSTSAIALKGLGADTFVKRLQDYRGMSKLLGTYLETFRREFGWCECGRAHCHLLPHGTFTGRFSSSDFNYQNLPKKYHYECDGETFDFNFRDCVTVPDGWWGMGFDISQGELRIIAAEAGEQAMLEAFGRGEDLHALTASRLLHITVDEVYAGGELFGKPWNPDSGGFRPFGKTMNFALGYQLTVQGLADRLACEVDEAQEAWDGYFAAYPAIAAWTRMTVADSKVNGYTMSRLGRRHPIWAYGAGKDCKWCRPGYMCKQHRAEYAGGERTAGNAPIQGALADMMKLIMIRCHAALKAAGLLDSVRLVMNIHDALEFYVRKDVAPQLVIDVLTPAIVAKTEWTAHWPVMQPDWHMFQRWGSQTELKLDENNQLIGLGAVLDIGMQEEDDEEDDADAPLAPATPGTLADAASAAHVTDLPTAGEAASRAARAPHVGMVVIRVAEMPDMASWQRFLLLMAESPGPNVLLLQTPAGSTTISSGSSLSPDDSARISVVLGGAEVFWDTATVDNDALADGLSLLREVGAWKSGRGSPRSTGRRSSTSRLTRRI